MPSARRALAIASGFWLACGGLAGGSGLGCGSTSDVVAIVGDEAPMSGGTIIVDAPVAQTDTAPTPPSTAALPTPPQFSGAAGQPAPVAPVPSDAVAVWATPRPLLITDAEMWPFPGTRLRDVFGTPGPNELLIRIIDDPIDADTYRRLGRPKGLVPGGPAVLVVVDDGFDQYDLFIQEGE